MTVKRISRAKEVELRLIELIKEGEWQNYRLPSETDIAEMFDVSRVTVREALSSLAGMGIVERKHGIGTFICKEPIKRAAKIQTRLDEPFELGAMIRQAGYRMSISVVNFHYGKASERIAKKLEISPDEETLTVNKIFLADNMPAVLVCDIMPLCPSPGENSLELRRKIDPGVQIFKLIEDLYGKKTSYLVSDIKPALVTDELAKYLSRPVGSPVLYIEEVAYSDKDEPLFCALEHHVPGIVNFRLRRTLT